MGSRRSPGLTAGQYNRAVSTTFHAMHHEELTKKPLVILAVEHCTDQYRMLSMSHSPPCLVRVIHTVVSVVSVVVSSSAIAVWWMLATR